MVARPFKCGNQGGYKYFFPDKMGCKRKYRIWGEKEWHYKPRDRILSRVNRKRQRVYNRYLCYYWMEE